MRKTYLQLNLNTNSYESLKEHLDLNLDLYILRFSLMKQVPGFLDSEENGIVTIYEVDSIKDPKWNPIYNNVPSKEEYEPFQAAYGKYWQKRWEEIPKIEITKENHEELIRDWEKYNYQTQPKAPFLVITMHDTGWISITTQEELSSQDLQLIEEDNKRSAIYDQKWNEYNEFNKHKPRKNNIWSSPADSEFYSDFLTEDEMVWKKK